MRFQASELSNYGDLTSSLALVKGAKVKDASGFAQLAINVRDAMAEESGASASDTASVNKVVEITNKITKPVELAPYFARLKGVATSVGAKKTADAITSAASWFYYNVENPGAAKPSAPASRGSSTDILPPSTGGDGGGGGGPIGWMKDHPLAVAGIGAGIVVLVVGAGIWYTDSRAASQS